MTSSLAGFQTILLLKPIRAQVPARNKPLRRLLNLLAQLKARQVRACNQLGHPLLSDAKVLGHLQFRAPGFGREVFFEFHPPKSI